MSALGSLLPFFENESQFVSFTFHMPVWNQPALSCPLLPWTRCPFCRTSTLDKTGPGVARRPSLLESGVDL
jgi:hypothetical protein